MHGDIASLDSRRSERFVFRYSLPLLLLLACRLNASGLQVATGDSGADRKPTGGAVPDAAVVGSGGGPGSGGQLPTGGTMNSGGTTTIPWAGDTGGSSVGGTAMPIDAAGIGGSLRGGATADGGSLMGSGGMRSGAGGIESIDAGAGGGGSAGGSPAGGDRIDGGVASAGGTLNGGATKDGSAGTSGGGTMGAGGDASAGDAPGCVLGPFRAPELITGLGLGTDDLWAPSLSGDGKTLYFAASGFFAGEDIYVATRSGDGPVFSPAVPVDSINTGSSEGTPCISYDGLTLHFYSDRQGGRGGRDMWVASRTTVQGTFGAAKLLAAVNGGGDDHLPWVSADELVLLFSIGNGEPTDLYITTRTSRTEDFSPPTALSSVNTTTAREDRAALSSDGLTITFTSNRPGGLGGKDIWVGTRSNSNGDFTNIANLQAVNSEANDMDVTLSRDGTELWFVSDRGGRSSLYRSVRACR